MGFDELTLTSRTAHVAVDVGAGGRVASLVVHDAELLVEPDDNPVLWGGYPMVPFAGRIRNGEFEFGEITYSVPKNFGEHAMHGFGFESPWTQISDDTIELEFAEPWPFAGRVAQRFSIDDHRLTITMTATADERQPIVLGWHPWFRKSTAHGEAILDFQPGDMYERGDEPLPTGVLVEPKPRPWDDCFTNLRSDPTISWGDLRVTLRSNADHWVVFDEMEHAICVEPQTGPPNSFNLAPQVLEEGDKLELVLTLDWNF